MTTKSNPNATAGAKECDHWVGYQQNRDGQELITSKDDMDGCHPDVKFTFCPLCGTRLLPEGSEKLPYETKKAPLESSEGQDSGTGTGRL